MLIKNNIWKNITACLLALIVWSCPSLSMGNPKNSPPIVEMNQTDRVQQNLIVDTYRYIDSIMADKSKPIIENDLKKYFTPDITMITNGKKVLTGYTALTKHFQDIRTKLFAQTHFPLSEILSAGNKIVLKYNIDFYQQDKIYPMNIIAIMTMQNNKIQQWDEVVYSSFLCSKER